MHARTPRAAVQTPPRTQIAWKVDRFSVQLRCCRSALSVDARHSPWVLGILRGCSAFSVGARTPKLPRNRRLCVNMKLWNDSEQVNYSSSQKASGNTLIMPTMRREQNDWWQKCQIESLRRYQFKSKHRKMEKFLHLRLSVRVHINKPQSHVSHRKRPNTRVVAHGNKSVDRKWIMCKNESHGFKLIISASDTHQNTQFHATRKRTWLDWKHAAVLPVLM